MRKLFLTGEVDEEMVEKTLKFIDSLDRSVEAFEVHLCTLGGCVYSGIAIYDLLKATQCKVNMLTHGTCMSSGVVILMAGDKRTSMPNCQFLVHYGSDSNSSGADVKHNADITKLMIDFISKGTKKSVRSIKSWLDKETYFNPQQALKSGLIEGIYDGN